MERRQNAVGASPTQGRCAKTHHGCAIFAAFRTWAARDWHLHQTQRWPHQVRRAPLQHSAAAGRGFASKSTSDLSIPSTGPAIAMAGPQPTPHTVSLRTDWSVQAASAGRGGRRRVAAAVDADAPAPNCRLSNVMRRAGKAAAVLAKTATRRQDLVCMLLSRFVGPLY